MDPITLSVAAVAYIGAEVAKKATNEATTKLWEHIKLGWKGVFGLSPAPDQLTVASLAKAVDESPEFSQAVTRVISDKTSFKRLRLTGHALATARILWIDDHPENNSWEISMLSALGAQVRTAESTRSAIALLTTDSFDLLISDIARSGSSREGLEALPEIQASSRSRIPVLFYVMNLKPAGVPTGAFGITDEPEELLHLVLDVLERSAL